MSLPYLISPVLSLIVLVLGLILFSENKKARKLKSQFDNLKKNHLYLPSLVNETDNSIEYGKTLENVINSLISNLEKTYPFSTLTSVFIKEDTVFFRATIKETISQAFIDHIKDELLASLSNPPKVISENVSGVTLDDLSTSQIMSEMDMKIIINGSTMAAINISSTSPGLYTEEDAATLKSACEIISGFLTKLESGTGIEKNKSLSMIDTFTEGIFMLDKDQQLIAMNNAALHFLNIHEQKPTTKDIFSALPNTYNFKDRIEASLSLNKQINEEDISIADKIFRVIITPVLENGATDKNLPAREAGIIGVTVLLQDTTVEKSLAHLKEDFTNIMVHELRSPLTAIKASSEFLLSSADLKDSEKKQLATMISDSSKKMLDKIALILDSAKMDADLFSIRKTNSDIKKLISDRVIVFAQVASEKSINFKLDLDPTIPEFPFDPIRIDEVINNLLSNSLKFTPMNGSIQLTTRLVDGKVTVSVSDTGSGIVKDKQHLLFSKFQQAPTNGSQQGTGLGLYVVKGVIEAHGGTVSLESEENKGTTISFTLPLSGGASAFALPPAPKSANLMMN